MAKRRGQSKTVIDVLQAIKDKDIAFVDLKFVDLFGTLQHLTLPIENFSPDLFIEGQGFDGSSVRGFQEIHESDMILKPDPATMFIDPFLDDPTLAFFCDIINPRGWTTYTRDPRAVATRAENYLKRLGFADKAFFGPELEFFIFDSIRYDQATQHGYYFIDNESGFWNTGRREDGNLGHKPARKRAYFVASPADRYQNLRSKMVTVLSSVGIKPELHHHEVGSGSQAEIGFRFGTLVKQADASIKFKYVIKNVADRYGKTATFMPKPLFEENGSGMHVHVSLWNGDENLFFDRNGYAELSEMAIHFIGGLLHHAPALCAFCAPTTNSYRRLVPGYEAPINLVYSQANRSACIRVPIFSTSPKAKRIEFRSPDPSCNQYLAFAAILMAGLDGIRHKIEPPEPLDEDIYEYVEGGAGKEIQNTPGSLAEAIAALKKDHDFLLRADVFSPDLLETYIDYKERFEIDYVRLRPHPGEFALYYDV